MFGPEDLDDDTTNFYEVVNEDSGMLENAMKIADLKTVVRALHI